MKKEKVSKSFTVIVAAYNSAKYIEKNLISIEKQNYPKNLIQVLVVDDGSTDNTYEVVNKIKEKSSINIEYHFKTNGNWGSVMNYVNENKLIKNDIVVILDSDDVFLKNCFKKVNARFQDLDAMVTCFKLWNGKHITFKVYPYYRCYRNLEGKKKVTPITWPGAYFYRKEIFESIGKLKENVCYQDNILLARAFNNSKKIKFCRITSGLYYISRKGNSMSVKWEGKRYFQNVDICEEMISMGWQEIVFFHVMQKGFRDQCKKENKKFYVKEKIKLNFFPIWIRWAFWIYFIIFTKKYYVVEKSK